MHSLISEIKGCEVVQTYLEGILHQTVILISVSIETRRHLPIYLKTSTLPAKNNGYHLK
jgi:hypothetical protein